MNHIYLSVYFAIIVAKSEQITISRQCICQQLQTEADCQKGSNCQWNAIEKSCSNSQVERIATNYCSSFTQSYNCIEQPPCAWDGKACTHFTACSAYSLKECNQISKRCMSDGLRCVEIDLCTTYKTKISCVKDKHEKYCYWNGYNCEDVKQCAQLPIYLNNDELCRQYISYCTAGQVGGCVEDPLCKAVFESGICTTNWITCVLRGTCAQAQAEAGCVTDHNDKPCQWIKPDNQTAYCMVRTCATAPQTLITEEQYKSYYTPTIGSCTTKKDGGCKLKGVCSAETVEDACKTDNTGADCWWDTDKCRLKECKDFYGSTHVSCLNKRSNCTAGLNGKWALITSCEATTTKAACIFGNNGPCLWINDFINVDGSKGACFKYDSCKSLAWTTDAQCKLISPNCTTDGTQCIGITSCAETNIAGGCKIGMDGQCIQTMSAKGANNTVCKLFYSCDVAYYLTHDECYGANSNCTSLLVRMSNVKTQL